MESTMDCHPHCDNCFKSNCDHASSCKLIECQQAGCGFRMHECKQTDHLDICSRVRVPCINSEFGCSLFMMRNDVRSHLERCPASVVSCSFVSNYRPRPDCSWPVQSKFKDHFKQQIIRDVSSLTSNIEPTLSSKQPAGELNGIHQLKRKPVCGSDFRRDEYCSHYRNVHCDIVSSLNGWMEKFCPNQQYGCMFNTKRMQPICNDRKTQIVFGKQNKAFGHLVVDNDNKMSATNDDEVNLTDLPVELISEIIGYLDGFSLNNISLTSKLLRSLCCNRLERRGLVSLIWKRADVKVNQINWTIAGYRWKFSNHFSLIEKWEFEDGNFLNHFSNDCKHFDKLINEKPFQLLGIGSKK